MIGHSLLSSIRERRGCAAKKETVYDPIRRRLNFSRERLQRR
jgi:hypothetical protein